MPVRFEPLGAVREGVVAKPNLSALRAIPGQAEAWPSSRVGRRAGVLEALASPDPILGLTAVSDGASLDQGREGHHSRVELDVHSLVRKRLADFHRGEDGERLKFASGLLAREHLIALVVVRRRPGQAPEEALRPRRASIKSGDGWSFAAREPLSKQG